MTEPVLEPSSSARPRAPMPDGPVGRLRGLVPRLFGIVILAVVAVLAYRQRFGLTTAAHTLGAPTVLLSLMLAVAGNACPQRVWSSVLQGLSVQVDRRDAAGVFFVSQLGKYVPGSVWPILAQMEFGKRAGVDRRLMATANLLMLALITGTGLFTGAVLLPWTASDGLRRYWWTLLLLIPLLIALHPKILTWLVNRVIRLMRGVALRAAIPARPLLLAVAWGMAMWLLLGLHLLVMTRSLGATGAGSAAAAIGGMGLAFATGLIIILAPAGAGVRDGVLIATFTPQLGATNALAVALASRVLMISADVLLAGFGAALRVRRPLPAG